MASFHPGHRGTKPGLGELGRSPQGTHPVITRHKQQDTDVTGRECGAHSFGDKQDSEGNDTHLLLPGKKAETGHPKCARLCAHSASSLRSGRSVSTTGFPIACHPRHPLFCSEPFCRKRTPNHRGSRTGVSTRATNRCFKSALLRPRPRRGGWAVTQQTHGGRWGGASQCGQAPSTPEQGTEAAAVWPCDCPSSEGASTPTSGSDRTPAIKIQQLKIEKNKYTPCCLPFKNTSTRHRVSILSSCSKNFWY